MAPPLPECTESGVDIGRSSVHNAGVTNEPTRIGLREARAILPDIVKQAADGATFIITVRGADRCAIIPTADMAKPDKGAATRKAKKVRPSRK